MFSSNTSQVSSAAAYIEDVFSTWLYTDTSLTPTITNGIDLATYGGLVWTKCRGTPTNYPHILVDTVRGIGYNLQSNNTNAQSADPNSINAVYTNGYKVNAGNSIGGGGNNYNFVSWTFRKQPKFFDVVTWTGNGSTAWRYLNHSLGSTPKCIIVKRTDTTGNWVVWHNDGSTDRIAFLNTTAAADPLNGNNGYAFGISSTQFVLDTVGGSVTASNASGGTYVAYLFAHNAGGFGDDGSQNVISCGSVTTDGSGHATVNLGYEPQWITWKSTDVGNWHTNDVMRGVTASSLTSGTSAAYLYPNSSSAENPSYGISINSTGFQLYFSPNTTYIYIAIRRGPMKTPTSGTSVFTSVAWTGTSAAATMTTGFVGDMDITGRYNNSYGYTWDRLRGATKWLATAGTYAESTETQAITWDSNTALYFGTSGYVNQTSVNYAHWVFGRAPGFFDQVCYTGTGGTGSRNIDHNLTVAPQLLIIKHRSTTGNWIVYNETLGAGNRVLLNTTAASGSTTSFASTAPTASVFTVDAGGTYNTSAATYTAYLFASCPGVSKVFTFTGNGSTQTINCGFTGGARFVLLKASSTTGNWYVFDTARGMTTSTDPWLALNTPGGVNTATSGACTTTSVGFAVDESKLTGVNTNGVTYIGLAIA